SARAGRKWRSPARVRPPTSAAGGLLQLFPGDARRGEGLVLGADGRTRFDDLAGGIEQFPLPIGVGAAAALEAQLDLKRVVLGHRRLMPEVCARGKGESWQACR